MTTPQNESAKPDWVHLIEEDKIGSAPLKVGLEPNEAERAALASRLGIIAVDALKASLTLTRQKGGAVVYVTGTIEADVIQECVVSLEAVPGHVSEEFEAWFADPESAIFFAKARQEREAKKQHGELPILDEKDDPEAIIDGQIDLADLVAQYLSLGLNPYPHAPGVDYELKDDDARRADDSEIRKNPFAALKDWKSGLTE